MREFPQRHSALVAIAAAAIGIGLLAGCNQRMADQPRLDAWETNDEFDNRDGRRVPPHGTVATAPPTAHRTPAAARDVPGKPDTAELMPPGDERPERAADLADLSHLLRRGQTRYRIHCVPCHGLSGHGDGMVPRRGFPYPPSYHTPRLRQKPLSYFVAVVGRGKGEMASYGDMLSEKDRWAVAAYVRALQLSQHAPNHLLDESDRRHLTGEP